MKVVILAGGLGTRLGEYTNLIPKPMVEIGGKPILIHIMDIYSHFGFKDFTLALGYKGEVIKEYFLNYKTLLSDFTINLEDGSVTLLNEFKKDWKITLLHTGDNTMTGGRVKRMKNLINETFMLTYGDAVSDIDIRELYKFHKSHGKIATVTAVHPPARFGDLVLNEKNLVTSFKEKAQTNQGWINGGFFIFEPEVFDYITGDPTELEKEPLEKLSSEGQLAAFLHQGFWQCMDTIRDKKVLDDLVEKKIAPWVRR